MNEINKIILLLIIFILLLCLCNNYESFKGEKRRRRRARRRLRKANRAVRKALRKVSGDLFKILTPEQQETVTLGNLAYKQAIYDLERVLNQLSPEKRSTLGIEQDFLNKFEESAEEGNKKKIDLESYKENEEGKKKYPVLYDVFTNLTAEEGQDILDKARNSPSADNSETLLVSEKNAMSNVLGNFKLVQNS